MVKHRSIDKLQENANRLTLAHWLIILIAVSGIAAYAFPGYVLVNRLFLEEIMISLVNRDFVNYWVAARMVLDGTHIDLFTQDICFERLHQLFGSQYPINNWGYPPHFLLLPWPLGYLSYHIGLVTFLALTFLVCVAGIWKFRKTYAPGSDLRLLILVVFSFSIMMVDTTQNGFLTGGLLLL